MSLLKPAKVTSLNEIWANLNPQPAGVLNQLLNNLDSDPALTATIFLPMQCRLVCGREDGSIILVRNLNIDKLDYGALWVHYRCIAGALQVHCRYTTAAF